MTDFDRIYRAYFGDVYLYLLRLCHDEALAEEIAGETFFRAMQALPKFRGECSVRVWLCQIAKNYYFTYSKKQRKASEAIAEDVPDPTPAPEEIAVRRSDIEAISAHLHALPDPYKEVFMWRVFGEMSFRQIGDIFHKTANWACVTYHRARAILRAEMEDTHE